MKKIEERPKVSIVIPVYNGERYVRYAIDSALAQTYDNIEIIVVNDGSTDKTDEIVKSYGNKVRYIKKKNGGVSSALNMAIEKMKGEYFSWLSHDDTYEPTKIEDEIDYLRENNYLGKKVIVFSDYNLINTKGKIIGESRKDHEEIVKKPEYILLKGHINGLSLLIPKQAFDDYGGFDMELKCVQDYEKWWQMMKTYKFVHIEKILVSTRWHKNQVTNTSPLVLAEGNAFYRKLIDAVSKKRKEELEGSEYNFYRELERFYLNTVYTDVYEYCKNQADKILDSVKIKESEKVVSVVIPFFDRHKEVMKAVSSVLKQTFENYEIILVDDGSKDDIYEVEELAKNNSKVKLYRNKSNLGASRSRNIGIEKATGDYIAFLDSDDEFEPNKLETQLKYMVASNANFSHTSYMRVRDGKKNVMHSGECEGHCERRLIYNCPIATPTVMLKTAWLRENNYRFDENLSIGEDTCFWLTLMAKGEYLLGIDQPLTIVNVGRAAAAYDDKKQVTGLKAIIKYLLESEHYSKYDYEIGLLMEAYASYVKKVYEEEPLVSGGPMHKLFFYIRTEGIGNTSKRVVKKFLGFNKKK